MKWFLIKEACSAYSVVCDICMGDVFMPLPYTVQTHIKESPFCGPRLKRFL